MSTFDVLGQQAPAVPIVQLCHEQLRCEGCSGMVGGRGAWYGLASYVRPYDWKIVDVRATWKSKRNRLGRIGDEPRIFKGRCGRVSDDRRAAVACMQIERVQRLRRGAS